MATRPYIEFRNVRDLEHAVVRNFDSLPTDLDLVVGIPRSGLLAASLLALHRNIPVSDLSTFLDGRNAEQGARMGDQRHGATGGTGRILLLDDSIASGSAMAKVRRRVEESSISEDVRERIIYGAAFAEPDATHLVDHFCEAIEMPRLFSWNLFSSPMLAKSCVDIDGVLCRDPSAEENDDGPNYERFLAEATPLFRPVAPLGHLVTSRLEKYRGLTEAWLAKHEIDYGDLHMLDLPSAEERRRLGAHTGFKASIYEETGAVLFIESEAHQAAEIAEKTRKPVICTDTSEIHRYDTLAVSSRRAFGSYRRRLRRKFAPVLHRLKS